MSNVSRWLKYAKAKLDSAIGDGHRELDELEAERERQIADKPWLASTGDAPTFDEAKARIEWEAEQAARAGGRGGDGGGAGDTTSSATNETGPTDPEPDAPRGAQPGRASADSFADGARSTRDRAPSEEEPATTAPITSPEERAAAAEAAQARLELEARDRESKARLDAIRAEMGIDTRDTPPESP